MNNPPVLRRPVFQFFRNGVAVCKFCGHDAKAHKPSCVTPSDEITYDVLLSNWEKLCGGAK